MRRIAVVRANALGDFIFTLPALDALRRAYPKAHVTLLARAWHADFLRGRGCVDAIEVLPALPGLGGEGRPRAPDAEVEAFLERMRERRFDLAFQMHGGGRNSNPFTRSLGARLTIGARTSDAQALDRCLPYEPRQNERLRLLELAALAGARARDLDPRLPVLGRDREELARHWTPDGRTLAVLQPGATDPRRRWPAESFAAVGDALAAEGAVVAVNGTDAERETTRAVIAAMRSAAVDLTGALSIGGLSALLGHASVVVSNDTGPLHLAQALGAPTVGIYWLLNFMAFSPLVWEGRRHFMSYTTRCPECGAVNLEQRCAHDPSFVSEVRVEEVACAARELLRQRAPRQSAAGAGRAREPRTPSSRPDPGRRGAAAR